MHVTIIQQGASPKVVPATGNLRTTLEDAGIDTEGFAILRGGVPVDLDACVTADITVTVSKKSNGAA